MNENKIKTYCFGSCFAFVLAFVVLFGLRLTVHAETTSQYPVPFGFGSGYGYDLDQSSSGGDSSPAYIPTDADIANIVSVIETNRNATCYGLFVREFNEDNYSFYFTLTDFAYGMPNDTYPSLGYWGYLNCWCYGTRDSLPVGVVSYIPSTGNVIVEQYSNSINRCDLFSGDGSACFAYSGVDIPLYPVWHINNSPIQVSSAWSSDPSTYRDGFVYFGNSGGGGGFDGPGFEGSASGELTPKSSVDGPGFDIDFDFFIDMNPLQILGEEIRDGIGSLIDKVEDGFSTVIGAIGDTFTMLQNNTQTLISKVQELASDFSRPTAEQIEDALDDSEAIGGLVSVHNKIKGIIDTLTTAGIEVPDAEDMEFDLPFHWKNYFYQPGVSDGWVDHTTTVHISFAWYESIRSKVLIVIYTFMAIGFAIYLFKQIPAILQGMAGSYSAGKSVSDVTANSGIDSYGYKNGVKTK